MTKKPPRPPRDVRARSGRTPPEPATATARTGPVVPEPMGVQDGPKTWLVMKGGGAPVKVRPAPAPLKGRPVFMIKDTEGLVRLHPEDIVHIQAKGNYVEVHRPRSRIVVHSSLTEVLKVLPANIMVRINRGQAVNVRRIEHIGSDEVLLADMVFTLSPRYRKDLLERIKVVTDR